ncbi:MarR family winged helix-turn-helix transcriptional regulator [Microlunatus speluncae]|uniref:MarR family winged helix-turn-helix transcriptional regulator n=1 Tax=Microlunatus speluncae TaxID=2594267 RepID=UPI001266195D|nr:MarR family transcriptional regulator [Microlunatus speluncae]
MGSVPWLDECEQDCWIALMNISMRLEGTLDSLLSKESGLRMIDYYVLAMLSESRDRTLTMGELAARTNSSPSRMSHVVKRLEGRGWVRRSPSEVDGRGTLASLTDAGLTKIEDAAPGHVRQVRRLIFDALGAEDLGPLTDSLTKIAERLTPPLARRSVADTQAGRT